MKLGRPGPVLFDPAAGVGPAADVGEDLLHRRAGLLGDDLPAAVVIAVLGGVAHRVPHVVEAAAVHQVHDELQLVEAFEIGDLRLVARFDERLEARLDQLAHPAAEDALFPEEIGLGLLGEGGLDHARPGEPDAAGVGQRQRQRLPRGVLFDGDQGRCPAPLDEQLTDAMSRRLGRDE